MWQLLGVLVLCGFVLHYFWWLAGLAFVWALVRLSMLAFADLKAQEAEATQSRAAVVARADQQHRWVLSGDPRGTFGKDYTPLTWPDSLGSRSSATPSPQS